MYVGTALLCGMGDFYRLSCSIRCRIQFPSAPPWLPITHIMGTDNTLRFRRVFFITFETNKTMVSMEKTDEKSPTQTQGGSTNHRPIDEASKATYCRIKYSGDRVIVLNIVGVQKL